MYFFQVSGSGDMRRRFKDQKRDVQENVVDKTNKANRISTVLHTQMLKKKGLTDCHDPVGLDNPAIL